MLALDGGSAAELAGYQDAAHSQGAAAVSEAEIDKAELAGQASGVSPD
ncbi:hypothetical protein OZ411_08045 [Bradyrhizobium sp. Arg237L]|nr:hypothetical protein [Bradyrhizobium sp. Arg237L]MDI4232760.1 hypothetical protein [Bradyrhizobium sp. Arg237L]